ncbi:MAG TPA: hypothetical protein VN228_09470 [Pyrinomonadaceae bacterium]|nr:hypothetical protein [Pyrinomonadaceae bacterium]
MRKLSKPRACLLALAALACVPCAAAAQARDRLIDWDWKGPSRPLPIIKESGEEGAGVETHFVAVELVEVSAAGRSVEVGSPFAAGDEWVDDLKLKFRNVSGKPIASAVVFLSYPEARHEGGVMTFSLAYGTTAAARLLPAVAPGEEFEVTRRPDEHERQRRRLAKLGGVTSVGRVGLGFVIVNFDDGGEWRAQLQALTY